MLFFFHHQIINAFLKHLAVYKNTQRSDLLCEICGVIIDVPVHRYGISIFPSIPDSRLLLPVFQLLIAVHKGLHRAFPKITVNPSIIIHEIYCRNNIIVICIAKNPVAKFCRQHRRQFCTLLLVRSAEEILNLGITDDIYHITFYLLRLLCRFC